MKINISYPATGCQKVVEITDDKKLRAFYDKRISQEVNGEAMGDEFKGYVFKISGGNDKEGFAMKQGVLTSQRVRLLFHKGMSCYRPRRQGERKKKSVRGCIVSADLSVLNLVVLKKGPQEIEGLTDSVKPRRLGPKRASKIRKMFNLDKKDDVRKYVIRRPITKEGKKPFTKAPSIQRLVTPQRLQRKRTFFSLKKKAYAKQQAEAKVYNELVAKRVQEVRDKRQAEVDKRRAERKSTGEKVADKKETPKETKKVAKKETPKEVKKPAAAAPKEVKKETPKETPKEPKKEAKKETKKETKKKA